MIKMLFCTCSLILGLFLMYSSNNNQWSNYNTTIKTWLSIDVRIKKNFAVLGASPDPTYLFPVLISALQWKKLGCDVIICLSNRTEDYETNPGTKFIIEELRKENVQLLFLPTEMAPPHTIAQVCRLFVAASPDITFNNYDTMITSDSDIWPFNISNHILPHDKDIFVYDPYCCGTTQKPNSDKKFRMYSMTTIAMTAETWRQILNVTEGWLKNGDALAQRLYNEFNTEFIRSGRPKPNYSESWYADQILISEKLGNFLNNTKDARYGEINYKFKYGRVDRSRWPRNFTEVNLADYTDAHILNPSHPDEQWNQLLGLLKMLFNEKEIIRIQAYRDLFVQRFKN